MSVGIPRRITKVRSVQRFDNTFNTFPVVKANRYTRGRRPKVVNTFVQTFVICIEPIPMCVCVGGGGGRMGEQYRACIELQFLLTSSSFPSSFLIFSTGDSAVDTGASSWHQRYPRRAER